MQSILSQKNIIRDKTQLLNIFYSGCKSEKNIGLEFEKLPIKNSNYQAAEFLFKNGILDFLDKYQNWGHFVPYYENELLLGLFMNYGAVSIEPGAQVEISLKPQNKISEIEKYLKLYNSSSSHIANQLGFSFLGLGSHPVSTFNDIKVIGKKRYSFMTEYLKRKGKLPFAMMRETAGIQVSIDYSSEEDAINKLSLALKLSPIISAFYSNSPIRNGKLCGYKSFRANSWLNTDNARCGLISDKLLDKKPIFSFSDYTNILLKLPMIFNKNKYFGELNFENYLSQNKEILLSDWENHLSLYFPDARLKNYIEIRNHDSQKMPLALSIPALYKGIMYSQNAIENILEMLKIYSFEDYKFIRFNAPKYGMNFKLHSTGISNLIKDIFYIAYESLKKFNLEEEKYLEPALELLEDNLTPADIIIKNFEGSWNKKISKLIEYSKII